MPAFKGEEDESGCVADWLRFMTGLSINVWPMVFELLNPIAIIHADAVGPPWLALYLMKEFCSLEVSSW